MSKAANSMILDVNATPMPNGKIRLKYVAVSGGCGPEVIMDAALARQTIDALTDALDSHGDLPQERFTRVVK